MTAISLNKMLSSNDFWVLDSYFDTVYGFDRYAIRLFDVRWAQDSDVMAIVGIVKDHQYLWFNNEASSQYKANIARKGDRRVHLNRIPERGIALIGDAFRFCRTNQRDNRVFARLLLCIRMTYHTHWHTQFIWKVLRRSSQAIAALAPQCSVAFRDLYRV